MTHETTTHNDTNNTTSSFSLEPSALVRVALDLTSIPWQETGCWPQSSEHSTPVLSYRITCLLACRAAAVHSYYKERSIAHVAECVLCNHNHKNDDNEHDDTKKDTDNNNNNNTFPLSSTVVSQLHQFVCRMMDNYKDIPYHNASHAYHVVLSANKLVEMMLVSNDNDTDKRRPTFGLRHDGLSLFALVFAALIHDVEHQGIPNRQLALEDDHLAVLYNDQSMAENWSLYIAFSELLQDEFSVFRNTLLPNDDCYRRFRKLVVNLVLNTDIASPERTQISKSKWKEAFGDPFETIERKLRGRFSICTANRRGSAVSALSGIGGENNNLHASRSLDDASVSGTPEPTETTDEDDGAMENELRKLLTHNNNGAPTLAAAAKFERRLSAASTHNTHNTSKYRQRLGILRTVDLSGETLETYGRRGSMGTVMSALSTTTGESLRDEALLDEPDELKATVVLETLITTADVAHNLQSWDHMVLWSSKLYMELRRAYVAKRGSDPQEKWFENQIAFLESYLWPIARRLEDTGVFPEKIGLLFGDVVQANRDRWLTEGFEVAEKTIADGAKRYPPRK